MSNIKIGKKAFICLFYTEWCPHSKKIILDWDLFKKSCKNREINGYALIPVNRNFTEFTWKQDAISRGENYAILQINNKLTNPCSYLRPPSREVDLWMEEYRITAFPTLRIIKEKQEIEYNSISPLSLYIIEKFVEETLNS